MTDSTTETVSGEVVKEAYVDGDTTAVHLTYVDLIDNSHTEQFPEDGVYKLVRVDDE